MRKKEQRLNDRLLLALAGMDPVRVENAAGPGTPDINYCDGWIESKVIDAWPRRADTPVAVPHYVAAQRAWHVRRSVSRGQVWVVLCIEATGEHLVFQGATAAQYLGSTNRDMMLISASLYMENWDKAAFRAFIHEGNRKQWRLYNELKDQAVRAAAGV